MIKMIKCDWLFHVMSEILQRGWNDRPWTFMMWRGVSCTAVNGKMVESKLRKHWLGGNCLSILRGVRGPSFWKETAWAFIYLILAQRNWMVFGTDRRKLEDLVYEFQRKTYEWIANCVWRKKLVWDLWLLNPLVSLQNSTKW